MDVQDVHALLNLRTAYSITLLYEFLFILFVASQATGLILEGRHNADVGWILELRTSGDAWVWQRNYFLFYF